MPIYKGADGLNLKRTAVVDGYLVSVYRERLWRGIDTILSGNHGYCALRDRRYGFTVANMSD